MAKNDISDGFYNVFVNSNGVKNFGVILPTPPGQKPLVLFFLTLPMGWVSSPPFSAPSQKPSQTSPTASSNQIGDPRRIASTRLLTHCHPPAAPQRDQGDRHAYVTATEGR